MDRSSVTFMSFLIRHLEGEAERLSSRNHSVSRALGGSEPSRARGSTPFVTSHLSGSLVCRPGI